MSEPTDGCVTRFCPINSSGGGLQLIHFEGGGGVIGVCGLKSGGLYSGFLVQVQILKRCSVEGSSRVVGEGASCVGVWVLVGLIFRHDTIFNGAISKNQPTPTIFSIYLVESGAADGVQRRSG